MKTRAMDTNAKKSPKNGQRKSKTPGKKLKINKKKYSKESKAKTKRQVEMWKVSTFMNISEFFFLFWLRLCNIFVALTDVFRFTMAGRVENNVSHNSKQNS